MCKKKLIELQLTVRRASGESENKSKHITELQKDVGHLTYSITSSEKVQCHVFTSTCTVAVTVEVFSTSSALDFIGLIWL